LAKHKLRQATAGFFIRDRRAVESAPTKLKELEEILRIWPSRSSSGFNFIMRSGYKKMIAEKYGADQVTTLYSETKDKEDSINRFK
jgi:hypothetical protein